MKAVFLRLQKTSFFSLFLHKRNFLRSSKAVRHTVCTAATLFRSTTRRYISTLPGHNQQKMRAPVQILVTRLKAELRRARETHLHRIFN